MSCEDLKDVVFSVGRSPLLSEDERLIKSCTTTALEESERIAKGIIASWTTVFGTTPVATLDLSSRDHLWKYYTFKAGLFACLARLSLHVTLCVCVVRVGDICFLLC